MSQKAPRLAPPASDDLSQRRRKKDTRRWCKGKVGRPHTPSEPVRRDGRRCRPLKTVGIESTGILGVLGRHWSCSHEIVCTECGKILEWWLPPESCPDYARAPTND